MNTQEAVSSSKRSRPAIRIEQIEESDLPNIAPFIHGAFEGEDIDMSMYPEWLKNDKITDDERYAHIVRQYSERLDDSRKGKNAFIKAVDVDTGKILGIAEWVLPGVPVRSNKDADVQGDTNLPKNPEADLEFLGRFKEAIIAKRESIMGDTPHWFLSIIIVDRDAQGLGVGSQLIAYGLHRADNADPPLPSYLEASAAGAPIYLAKGYKLIDNAEIEAKDQHGNAIKTLRLPCMVRPAKRKDA